MTSSKQETQRQTILHFWKKGTRNAAEIHSLTKIPLMTIYRNLKKIKVTGDVQCKSGSGRIKKITPNASRAIGQYVRRESSISSQSIADRLEDIDVNVSFLIVSRYLVDLGYQNILSLYTSILISVHKQKYVK